MIKLILSDEYDITHYTDNYNISSIALGYLKTKGYVLIHRTEHNTWFYCVESNTRPTILNENWQFSTKEIKEITNHLDKICSSYINRQADDWQGNTPNVESNIYVDVLGFLLDDLAKNYESDNYTKLKSINDEEIRQFILNPVDSFDKYLNSEPLSFDEFKIKKNEVQNTLMNKLNDVLSYYNKNKNIVGYSNKEENSTAPLVKEREMLKMIHEIAQDSIGNPILNLNLGIGKVNFNRLNAIDEIIREFDIKRSYDNNIEKIYLFDDELGYYEEINEISFKNKLYKRYGFNIMKSDIKAILESISIENQIHNNLLVFNNILYDVDRLEEFQFPICEYDRKNYLTVNRIGCENQQNRNKINLIDYDHDLAMTDFLKVKEIPTDDINVPVTEYSKKYGMTYVEKTLRQILIPKDEPNNLNMFKDFLERLGSCITGENINKTITLYYGNGNNGKGILKLANESIFNKQSYPLTPNDIGESFSLTSYMNRKVILIDEIDRNSFNNVKPELKRMSSPKARVEQRIIYSNENAIINSYPNIFIFANELPYLTMEDVALFYRLDFLMLPNVFVESKDLHKYKNAYLIDKETEIKMTIDLEGLSWLITASILCYKAMKESKATYTLKQSVEESMDIFLNTDYLTKFIKIYTERDNDLIQDDFITTSEIISQYKEYMAMQNKTINESDRQLSKQVGSSIKKVYNIEGSIKDSEIYHKRNNTTATYGIILKSFDDIAKEYQYIYKINENATESNMTILDSNSENKTIYRKIQKGINTKNLLNKAFPDKNINRIITELESLGLIINTYTTRLDYENKQNINNGAVNK